LRFASGAMTKTQLEQVNIDVFFTAHNAYYFALPDKPIKKGSYHCCYGVSIFNT